MPTNDPAFTEGLGDELPSLGRRSDEGGAAPPRRRGPGAARVPLAVALGGAVLGALFSGVSTADFMAHLDRQVHAITCSFIPGAAKEIAESGCRTVMMSPYSSFFREQLWGGVPVSLWALAVFAWLAYRAAFLLWRDAPGRGETRVLLVGSLLPVAASVLFGALAIWKLDALCKVCVGIYASSAIVLAGAALAHRRTAGADPARLAVALAEGTALAAVLTAAYVALAPASASKGSRVGCGSLVRAEDAAGVMIPLGGRAGGTPAVEVLDPLCPSCKAFDARLAASAFGDQLDLQGVLFPLDSTCNWMVTEAIHPGACAVSEAVLCAAGAVSGRKDPAAAGGVLKWAFARQAELRDLAARDERALRDRLEREFPSVKGCLGGALVRSKLTKSLRWAVANAIPVLTPQLFVAGRRLCDEDTDLGLEFTLARMLSPEAEAERARIRAAQPPPPRPPQPDVAAAPAAAPIPAAGA
ncbi:MAG TPA: vitamin K epoxide reductase family protein, partial [Anaeromyxobacter sp.]